MGKLLRGMVSLAIICALLLGAAYWYVQPAKTLDLNYSELQVRDKVTNMLTSRKLEVELTEPEVNSLLKKALAAHTHPSTNVEITGAQFSLEGSEWVADVNLLYKGQWTFGAKLYFDMSWKEPYLKATHTATRIKEAAVPLEWFHLNPLQIQLNDYVPKPAAIREIAFEDHGLRIGLKLR
ncbi:hypothetical protein [Paenibacillus sp. UNC451MF]|uniref:hypothetical protein n=1 Tax=Paenibacillus sp. UNC451MF TaxID=1449063 RepID=UPI00048D04FF|nr:hypothetical protein [Paenibacillus sp. UNC451MF]